MAAAHRIARAGLGGLLAAAMAVTAHAAPSADAQEGTPPVARLAGPDRIATAVAVSEHAFPAADVAVIARAGDFADALVAAPLAAALDAPILLTPRDAPPPAVAAELDRLGASRLVVMGGEAAISTATVEALRGDRAIERIAGEDRFGTAAAAALAMRRATGDGSSDVDDEGEGTSEDAAAGTDSTAQAAVRPGGIAYVATGGTFPDALAAGPLAAAAGDPIVLVTSDAIPPDTAAALEEVAPDEIVVLGGHAAVGAQVEDALAQHAPVRRLSGPTRYDTAAVVFDASVAAGLDPGDLWLADGRAFPDALVAGPVIGARGASLLLVDGRQLAAQEAPYERMRGLGDALASVTVLGGTAAITASAAWQIEGIVHGPELPRGGRLMFPHHRLVALYGNARSPAMGSLGEQPPEEAAQRVARVAAPYAAGGRSVLPTFELIATVATASPGEDGMYRVRAREGEIGPYLETARRHGLYLLLDIQPGQSDFLTEVRHYERYLVEPDVGIALDPEWRMPPGRRPGDGVGHVEAAEVNQVVDYVARLVGAHHLPQKLFVVHSFQDQMIRSREDIQAPEELAVTIHMDGFGSRTQKMATYARTVVERPKWNGFKLFYDEDTNMFQPHEILSFDVVPDLITHQ